jgi:hypothetical protein
MNTQAEIVMKSLVEAYNMIKSLSDKINQLENRTPSLPWEDKQVSYNNTPVPTPAIENLATGMVRQMVAKTFNDCNNACKRIYAEHDKVVLWKNGVVTTLGESINTKNPLAVFKSRACARIRLRLAGYNVPYAVGSANLGKGTYAGASTQKYLIAYKS